MKLESPCGQCNRGKIKRARGFLRNIQSAGDNIFNALWSDQSHSAHSYLTAFAATLLTAVHKIQQTKWAVFSAYWGILRTNKCDTELKNF